MLSGLHSVCPIWENVLLSLAAVGRFQKALPSPKGSIGLIAGAVVRLPVGHKPPAFAISQGLICFRFLPARLGRKRDTQTFFYWWVSYCIQPLGHGKLISHFPSKENIISSIVLHPLVALRLVGIEGRKTSTGFSSPKAACVSVDNPRTVYCPRL